MSELSNKDSDSDVDSNSSWTLLTEDANGGFDGDRSAEKNKQAKENVTPEAEKNENTPKIKENELATEDEEKKSVNSEINRENDAESLNSVSTSSLDCLPEVNGAETSVEQENPTVDEYVTDKELAHDYDYDDRAEFWEYLWNTDKQKKRKNKKCKGQNLKTVTIVGAVLSLAGISLLCMIAPLFSRHSLTPEMQRKIENNFTEIETPYAADKNFKFYIDKSNKAMKLIDNIDILDPYIQQCCDNHMKSTKSEKTSPKDHQETVNSRPLTLEQFLKENPEKNRKKEEPVETNVKELGKSKGEKNTNGMNSNEERKLKTTKEKPAKSKKKSNKMEEKPADEETNLNNILNHDSAKKSQILKKSIKELKIKEVLEKNKGHFKKNINQVMNNKNAISVKEIDTAVANIRDMNDSAAVGKKIANHTIISNKKKCMLLETKQNSAPPEKCGNFQNSLRRVVNTELPSFVLVNKQSRQETVSRRTAKRPSFSPINKENGSSKNSYKENDNSTKTHSLKEAKNVQTGSLVRTIRSAAATPHFTPDDATHRRIFIACQILQDICVLRITAKLKAKEKSREKMLKRRLSRKKVRAAKTSELFCMKEGETQQSELRKENENRITATEDNFFLHSSKPMTNFKPRSVENHFLTQFKRNDSNKTALSNFDLLKELPFMLEKKMEKKECIIISRSQPRIVKSVTIKRIESAPFNDSICETESQKFKNDTNISKRQRYIIYNETAKHNIGKFLDDTQKKNEERLKTLEKLREENRLKINEIIRERKERLQKDASLGIYNVPVPEYKEISEKLKQLKKRKIQHGFNIESVSSSDTESEQRRPKSVENNVSCELMTALKMGKKVSDTFREWTLKKAPTLTCLKNYCSSKVSQISEKLSSQSENQTNIIPSLNREELEALKCRKEKHEQLKKFWKAKQDYLDKRIEICDLLKEKLSTGNTTERCISDQNISHGVQILDSIINDVLRSVRNSKSHTGNTTCQIEKEEKKISKSAGSVVIVEQPKQNTECRRIETFSGNSDDLYDWLFEKKAMAIRNRDRSFWTTRPGHVERRKDVSKQDPSKVYHEKIIKKHN